MTLEQTLETTDELARIVENNERVVLTRDGEAVAVVLSIDDYRSLEATAALLEDPENLRRALAADERLKSA
jgi:prevent-host-death family protein